MATRQQQQFSQRMSKISRRHSKLSRGYTASVTSDGLVVPKAKLRGGKALLRSLAIVFVVIALFKAALYVNLGPAEYEARVESLSAGNAVQQSGAFVMTADPLTTWLAEKIVSLVR